MTGAPESPVGARPAYFVCDRCETPFRAPADLALAGAALRGRVACPFCRRRKLRFMGFVAHRRVWRSGQEVPCDGRCTNAKGPSCDCVCGGVNHGTGRLVEVAALVMIAKDAPSDLARHQARVALDRRAAAVALRTAWRVFAVRLRDLRRARRSGAYLGAVDYRVYRVLTDLRAGLRGATGARNLARKAAGVQAEAARVLQEVLP